jgi:hypothetical protein
MNKIPFAGIIITSLGVLISISRRYLLFSANQTVKKDMEAYNRAWHAVLCKSNTPAALTRLASLCERARLQRPKGWFPRQCNRLAAKSETDRVVHSPAWSPWSHSLSKIMPSESDQLSNAQTQRASSETQSARHEVVLKVSSDVARFPHVALDYGSPVVSLDQVMKFLFWDS